MARMVHLNGPNGLSRSSSKKNNRNFIPSHSTSIILDPGKWERAMTTIRETSNLLNGLKAMTATIAIATLLNRASYFHHLIRKAGFDPISLVRREVNPTVVNGSTRAIAMAPRERLLAAIQTRHQKFRRKGPQPLANETALPYAQHDFWWRHHHRS